MKEEAALLSALSNCSGFTSTVQTRLERNAHGAASVTARVVKCAEEFQQLAGNAVLRACLL